MRVHVFYGGRFYYVPFAAVKHLVAIEDHPSKPVVYVNVVGGRKFPVVRVDGDEPCIVVKPHNIDEEVVLYDYDYFIVESRL
jgi:hypothetical protein